MLKENHIPQVEKYAHVIFRLLNTNIGKKNAFCVCRKSKGVNVFPSGPHPGKPVSEWGGGWVRLGCPRPALPPCQQHDVHHVRLGVDGPAHRCSHQPDEAERFPSHPPVGMGRLYLLLRDGEEEGVFFPLPQEVINLGLHKVLWHDNFSGGEGVRSGWTFPPTCLPPLGCWTPCRCFLCAEGGLPIPTCKHRSHFGVLWALFALWTERVDSPSPNVGRPVPRWEGGWFNGRAVFNLCDVIAAISDLRVVMKKRHPQQRTTLPQKEHTDYRSLGIG